MPADALLQTLLRSLRTTAEQQDTPRLLSTASALLVTLRNPFNLTLLTSQLLLAPAIWIRSAGLKACVSVMGAFHSAADAALRLDSLPLTQEDVHQAPANRGLPPNEWLRAIIDGSNDRSPSWRRSAALGGLLLAIDSRGNLDRLSSTHRATLEHAFVQAINQALNDACEGEKFAGQCATLIMSHAFPTLSDSTRELLDYDRLLPVFIESAFFSPEGLQSAYFLASINLDVVETAGQIFNWSPESESHRQLQELLCNPLVSCLGPCSQLIAYAIAEVGDPWVVRASMENIVSYTRALVTQWRQNKLSEIDRSKEVVLMSRDLVENSLPTLWKLLKISFYSTIVLLNSVIRRVLTDRALASNAAASVLVIQTLHALRNLYFISSRLGDDPISQYTFVYLTAMDILSRHNLESEIFLNDIQPTQLGTIPLHPLERILDVFFLNTAEHLSLVISSQVVEDLIVPAAIPYLSADRNLNSTYLFESAHCAILAVLSAPQNALIAGAQLPFYSNALFGAFPDSLTPQQFRLAFKSLMRLAKSQTTITGDHTDLSATLLEILYHRALNASRDLVMPPKAQTYFRQLNAENNLETTEQAVLTLTLLEALPLLSPDLLGEWLPLATDLICKASTPLGAGKASAHEVLLHRFWDILVAGELDAECGLSCVRWWASREGRQTLLHDIATKDNDSSQHYMSGALQTGETKQSRL